jgi:hypothetical protein
MRVIYELFKIAIGVTAGASLVAIFKLNLHIFGDYSPTKPIDLSYSDLAAINLTAATVVLGGVALIVAVAAVFGFQIIRTESVTNAASRVRADLPDMVQRELKRMEKDGRLSRAVERAIYSGGKDDDGSQSVE